MFCSLCLTRTLTLGTLFASPHVADYDFFRDQIKNARGTKLYVPLTECIGIHMTNPTVLVIRSDLSVCYLNHVDVKL